MVVAVSAGVAACVLAWMGLATLVVPALIESAYRGESLPALNAIIEGRGAFPVDHYLQAWNTLAWQFTAYVLVYLSVAILIATVVSRPGFFRTYVGEATPGTLGAIRMLTCTALLVTTSWEDLASVALLPPEMRHGAGMMRTVLALPGFERFVASGVALGTLQTATELLLFMGAIGCFTRIVIPLSAVAHFVLLGILIDYSFFWHQNLVPLYLLAVLSFTPCDDGWSVDRLWKLWRGRDVPEGPAPVYGWARYICWVVIALPYAESGLSKLRIGGLSWWSATNMRAMLYVDNLSPREYEWNLSTYLVSAPDGLFTFLGITTVILEVFFFLVLFSRRARWVLPILMLMVHAGIFALQRILFFDLMLLQLAFIDFARLRDAVARRAAAGRRPIEVLYDGGCSVCRRTVRILRAFDLFTVLRFRDITRLDLADWRDHSGLEFDRPQLERSMHVVSGDGVFCGFAAYRVIARALPVFWPLVPWLYLPGVPRLGTAVYDRIAATRIRQTCDEACPIEHPPRIASDLRTPRTGGAWRYPLIASALVVMSVVCWIHRVEFYPLTAWHLYAMLDTSGTVSYRKVLARQESGTISPVRLEDGIGALALDGRYSPMLDKCFGNPADVALCQKFLSASGSAYNARQAPGSRLTQFEIQTWRWDFVSSPSHPEQGQLLDRVVIDISPRPDSGTGPEPVRRSSQLR
jgi:predicted DCC family thiol-disulfide oxidoreductase YuxK